MKKLIVFLGIVLLLAGCETKEMDYTAEIDDMYGEGYLNVYNEEEVEQEPGTASHWTFEYQINFITFEDMMNSEYSNFLYGRVVEERKRTSFSTYLYVEVYETEFTNGKSIIRIAKMNEDGFASVGGTYVFNLFYLEEYDEYQFSQQADSVIRVTSGNIWIPDRFYEELKDKKDIALFLKYIFPDSTRY